MNKVWSVLALALAFVIVAAPQYAPADEPGQGPTSGDIFHIDPGSPLPQPPSGEPAPAPPPSQVPNVPTVGVGVTVSPGGSWQVFGKGTIPIR